MKRLLFVLCALAATSVLAEETKIEKLGENLWRVRMSRNGKFGESALNRYGIIEKLAPQVTTEDCGIAYAAKQVGKGFELRFPLAKGECVYGLGDAGRESLERRGRAYEIWVKNITGDIPIHYHPTRA